MAYDLVVTKGAEKDIDDAVLWYEEQQTNLGLRFYFEVLKSLEIVKANPQYFSFLQDEYRQMLFRSFPYKLKIRPMYLNDFKNALTIFLHTKLFCRSKTNYVG